MGASRVASACTPVRLATVRTRLYPMRLHLRTVVRKIPPFESSTARPAQLYSSGMVPRAEAMSRHTHPAISQQERSHDNR